MARQRIQHRLAGGGANLLRRRVLGAADGDPITVPGIKRGDELVSVVEVVAATASAPDVLAAEHSARAAITGANQITITGADTTSKVLDVLAWSY